MLWEGGKIKKVLSLGKSSEQEVFWGWNCDFLRSFEPDAEKSHSYKKRVYYMDGTYEKDGSDYKDGTHYEDGTNYRMGRTP